MTIAEQKARLDELLDPAVPAEGRVRPVRMAPDDGEVEVKLLDQAEPTTQVTGEFLAKVSDFEVDRQNERFARHAFDSAVAKLRADSRAVPVLYGHDQASTTAIIVHVPPDGWEADEQGLFARGWIDTTADVGCHVYGMLKKGALSWSIGFSIDRAAPGRDGVRVLEEVGELYELSVVPVPANSRTATLAMKGTRVDIDPPPTHDEQVANARELGLATPADQRIRDEERNTMLRLFDQADEKALDDQPPSHLDLELQLLREGYITRPAELENYERVDPVVLGTGSNGHGSSDEKAFATMPAIKIASFEV